MDAKNYKRWALNGLRYQAEARGIEVKGRKDGPRLLLRKRRDLTAFYQERWWRSSLGRSGFGGSFEFESDAADEGIGLAIAPLINLPDFFLQIRSPRNVDEISYFLDRLVQLADWCVTEKFSEFQRLAQDPRHMLSKVSPTVLQIREFGRSGNAHDIAR